MENLPGSDLDEPVTVVTILGFDEPKPSFEAPEDGSSGIVTGTPGSARPQTRSEQEAIVCDPKTQCSPFEAESSQGRLSGNGLSTGRHSSRWLCQEWMRLGFIRAVLVAGIGCAPVAVQAQEEPQNVQVLTELTYKEITQYMKTVSKSVGKKCTFCHVEDEFHLDQKEHKVQARDMMKMLKEMNEKYLKGRGTCYMCHRGTPEPILEP